MMHRNIQTLDISHTTLVFWLKEIYFIIIIMSRRASRRNRAFSLSNKYFLSRASAVQGSRWAWNRLVSCQRFGYFPVLPALFLSTTYIISSYIFPITWNHNISFREILYSLFFQPSSQNTIPSFLKFMETILWWNDPMAWSLVKIF